MAKRPPPIDEIVGLLATRSPEVLERLRRAYPEHADILEPGFLLGEAAADLRLRVEAACAGGKIALELGEENIHTVRRRLARAKTITSGGQILTAIGGASVITTLSTAYHQVTYLGGFIALAGSILPFAAQYLSTGLQAENLFDTYSALVECNLEAAEVQQILEIWLRKEPKENDDPSQVVARANALAKKIKLLISKI